MQRARRRLGHAAKHLWHEIGWIIFVLRDGPAARDSLQRHRLLRLLYDERDESLLALLPLHDAGHASLSIKDATMLTRIEERSAARLQLMAALASGDEASVVREATATAHLGQEGLGLGERRQIAYARARLAAQQALQTAVDEHASPRTIVDAWWRAVLLGCDLPGVLTVAALEARRRLGYDRLGPVSPSPPRPETALPVRPAPQRARDLRADRVHALEALDAACRAGDDAALVQAAGRARLSGVHKPDGDDEWATVYDGIDWASVYAAERRHRDQENLRTALRNHDVAAAARAWSHARARWDLDPDLDQQGRRAFQQWGRSLQQEQSVDTHVSP